MEILYLICGIIIGAVTTVILSRLRRAGSLVINMPDTDDPPYLSADLDQPVGSISKKKYVVFKIDIRQLSTHE